MTLQMGHDFVFSMVEKRSRSGLSLFAPPMLDMSLSPVSWHHFATMSFCEMVSMASTT